MVKIYKREISKYITYLSHKIVKEVNECDNDYDAREEVENILINFYLKKN